MMCQMGDSLTIQKIQSQMQQQKTGLKNRKRQSCMFGLSYLQLSNVISTYETV